MCKNVVRMDVCNNFLIRKYGCVCVQCCVCMPAILLCACMCVIIYCVYAFNALCVYVCKNVVCMYAVSYTHLTLPTT